jgi:hypothetical protein
MSLFNPFLIPILALSIPIVAIVMRGLTTIVRMVIEHRERMAMIDMGLDPDNAMSEHEPPALPPAPPGPPPIS